MVSESMMPGQPKILRLLEPQGEPEIIECDGKRYLPKLTCSVLDMRKSHDWYDERDPIYHYSLSCGCVIEHMYPEPPRFCPGCGAEVSE